MKKLLLTFSLLILLLPIISQASPAENRLKGRILLQVEENGEAWYVKPDDGERMYMKDGDAAYNMMRNFGLGISNADITKIPIGFEDRFECLDSDGDSLCDKLEDGLGTDRNNPDTDGDGYNDGTEVKTNYDPLGNGKLLYDLNLANKLKGKILLQVETNGEAWYIHPDDGKRYYMPDGPSAYQIMRFLSLGISNKNLALIDIGDYNFYNNSDEKMIFPKVYYDNIRLNDITSIEGLVLPETLNGNLYLRGLTSAEGLILPKIINGYLDLASLTSAKGVVFPETIQTGFNLSGLTSTDGLVLPKNLDAPLWLDGLTSAEGLVLPETMNGPLTLRGLTSAKGLNLPTIFNSAIYLDGLTSAEGLVLPETLKGHIVLTNLTSAEGLVLPKNVGGNIDLPSLTSSEGLVLPDRVDGIVSLKQLSEIEKEELRNTYPNLTIE